MSGKRPSSTLATANGTAAGKKPSSRQQRPAPYVFQAKVQLGDETRSMHMTGQVILPLDRKGHCAVDGVTGNTFFVLMLSLQHVTGDTQAHHYVGNMMGSIP